MRCDQILLSTNWMFHKPIISSTNTIVVFQRLSLQGLSLFLWTLKNGLPKSFNIHRLQPPYFTHLYFMQYTYIKRNNNDNNNFVADLQQQLINTVHWVQCKDLQSDMDRATEVLIISYTNYHIQILWILPLQMYHATPTLLARKLTSFPMDDTSIWMQLYYYNDLLPYFVACRDYHYYVNLLLLLYCIKYK